MFGFPKIQRREHSVAFALRKPLVYVSYDHRTDRSYLRKLCEFIGKRCIIVQDTSLELGVREELRGQAIKRFRDDYLYQTDLALVLCGRYAWRSRDVDWEISAALEQGLPLIAVNLPTNLPLTGGGFHIPEKLAADVRNGYALFVSWKSFLENPTNLDRILDQALRRPTNLIDQRRQQRNTDVVHAML